MQTHFSGSRTHFLVLPTHFSRSRTPFHTFPDEIENRHPSPVISADPPTHPQLWSFISAERDRPTPAAERSSNLQFPSTQTAIA
ncbi:MAG: hypothetical protein ACKO24_16605 [Leptolyngbyaceae cyanobacterium]